MDKGTRQRSLIKTRERTYRNVAEPALKAKKKTLALLTESHKTPLTSRREIDWQNSAMRKKKKESGGSDDNHKLKDRRGRQKKGRKGKGARLSRTPP